MKYSTLTKACLAVAAAYQKKYNLKRSKMYPRQVKRDTFHVGISGRDDVISKEYGIVTVYLGNAYWDGVLHYLIESEPLYVDVKPAKEYDET